VVEAPLRRFLGETLIVPLPLLLLLLPPLQHRLNNSDYPCRKAQV